MEHNCINFDKYFEPNTQCHRCKKWIRNEETFYVDIGDWRKRFDVVVLCKDCFDKVVKTINEIKEA